MKLVQGRKPSPLVRSYILSKYLGRHLLCPLVHRLEISQSRSVMTPYYPSVQSFFQPVPPLPNVVRREKAVTAPGDAFTEEEVGSTLDPLSSKFNPSREYVRCDIGTLVPGPQTVTFKGRVVNFSTIYGRSKSYAAAKGWHHIIVKDNTGAVHVKLYFVNKTYDLRLGLLITIWTPYVGTVLNNINSTASSIQSTTSIFPGREASVHIVMHQNSDVDGACRLPLGCLKYRQLDIMPLRSFIDGGNEVPEKRILACVKSIGSQKTITNKKGMQLELTEVSLFDNTAVIMLKLWGDVGLSAKKWRPSGTILLFSNPSFRLEYRGASIGLSPVTMVDIDPKFSDAEWLRQYAAGQNKRESVDQTFPQSIWNSDAAVTEKALVLFTIADIDKQVRGEPARNFTGVLSVIITDVCLVLYFGRKMLMCTECCGMPIYANTTIAICKNCEKKLILRLNPKVIGTLVDETGNIASGKLLWSEKAWKDLFGRTFSELITDDGQIIRSLEQRMKYMRITVVFGWSEDVGKLAVLAVRM